MPPAPCVCGVPPVLLVPCRCQVHWHHRPICHQGSHRQQHGQPRPSRHHSPYPQARDLSLCSRRCNPSGQQSCRQRPSLCRLPRPGPAQGTAWGPSLAPQAPTAPHKARQHSSNRRSSSPAHPWRAHQPWPQPCRLPGPGQPRQCEPQQDWQWQHAAAGADTQPQQQEELPQPGVLQRTAGCLCQGNTPKVEAGMLGGGRVYG